MTELWERDAYELADEIRAGTLRSSDVVDHFLARIERFDPVLNATCDLDAPGAREQAAAIRKARDAALADPEGKALGTTLGKPVVWMKPVKSS